MNEQTLINWIKWIAMAVLCVPLVFSVYMYPSHAAPQTFLFRALVEAMLALYLILVLKNSAYLPRFSVLTWALTAFMGAFAIAGIFGENPVRSFFSDFERHWGFITVIHFYILFLILSSVFRERRSWQTMFGVSVGVSVVVALYGVYQLLFEDIGRIYSTIGNPAFLSTYLLLNAVIAWWCAGDKELPPFVQKAFLAAAAGTATVALFTGTRAALLAFVAGSVVAFAGYFFWRKRGEIKSLQRFFLLVTLTIAIGASVSFAFGRSDLVQKTGLDRLIHISASDVTAQTRLHAWKSAIESVRFEPLLGVGPENFNVVFNKYFDADFYAVERSETHFDRAHNIFLEVFATMGIVGFLAYLSMFGAFLYVVHKQRKDDRITARTAALFAAFVAGYFVQGFFSMDALTTFLPIFLVFAYFAGGIGKDKRSQNTPSAMGFSDVGAGVAIICAVVVVCWFVNVRPMFANIAFSNADAADKAIGMILPEETLNDAYSNYQKSLSYGAYGQETVRAGFARFAVNFYQAFGSGGPAEFKEKVLPAAVAEAKENVRRNPNNYLYYADLARVYNTAYLMTKRTDADAEAMIARAEMLAPERLEVPFALAQRDLLKGDFASAIALANDGIARSEYFIDFYHIAFLGYAVTGDDENAFRVLDAGVNKGLMLRNTKEMLWLAQQYGQHGMEQEAREWFMKAEQQ